MAALLIQPTPHREAVQFIAGKPAVSRAVFDRLLPELQARAFTISGITALDVIQDARDAIAALPAGGDWDEIKGRIAEDILPYFVDPDADADTQAAQTRAAERRAELLLRTHGQQAYAAAAYNVADEQRDLFPFWQYQTLGDTHVRDTHAALDGIVLPHDHPFWQTHTPPWDWGCRCQFIPLSDDDVEELRAADAALPPEKRRVLGEAEQQLLAEGRTIHRDLDGNGARPYYIGSASEDGKPGAFRWHPGDLRLPLADLRARYDADVWEQFETWAKQQKLPGKSQTVFDWLENKPLDADPAPKPFVKSRRPLLSRIEENERAAAAADAAEEAGRPAKLDGPWKPRALTDAEVEAMERKIDALTDKPTEASDPRAEAIVAPPEMRDALAALDAIRREEKAALDRHWARVAIYRSEHPDGNASEEIAAWSNRERKKIEADFAGRKKKATRK